MNSDSPRDGNEDEGEDEFPVWFFPVIKFDQEVNRDKEIQEQIAIEDKDIPCQKRSREVHQSDKRNHVPDPVEPAEVNNHKENGHDDRGGGNKFSEDDDFLDRLELVDIGRDNQKQGRGRPAPPN